MTVRTKVSPSSKAGLPLSRNQIRRKIVHGMVCKQDPSTECAIILCQLITLQTILAS